MAFTKDNDLYTFTIDNESITAIVPDFGLTGADCEEVAHMAWAHFEDFIQTVAYEYRRDHPRIIDMPVSAHVQRQYWQNDYAMPAGEQEFDCQLALDRFELSELPIVASERGDALNYLDDLFFMAVELGLTSAWDGPFECYIDDDDEYEAYIAARIKREYGYEITDRYWNEED